MAQEAKSKLQKAAGDIKEKISNTTSKAKKKLTKALSTDDNGRKAKGSAQGRAADLKKKNLSAEKKPVTKKKETKTEAGKVAKKTPSISAKPQREPIKAKGRSAYKDKSKATVKAKK